MFVRVPKNAAPFLATRPNISESHSEISTRVPVCIAPQARNARLQRLRQAFRDLCSRFGLGAAPLHAFERWRFQKQWAADQAEAAAEASHAASNHAAPWDRPRSAESTAPFRSNETIGRAQAPALELRDMLFPAELPKSAAVAAAAAVADAAEEDMDMLVEGSAEHWL